MDEYAVRRDGASLRAVARPSVWEAGRQPADAQPELEPGRSASWLVFAVAMVVLLLAAAYREPWRTDEHRYIEIAREMVSTGSWIVPHLNGSLYVDKPPGFFWSVAMPYTIGVPLALAGMLPSIFGAALTLALTFALGRRAFGTATAWTAVTILASIQLFASLAVRANLDALLTASATASCYALWRAIEAGAGHESARGRWFLGAGLAMGFGMLVKGPVALVVPVSTLLAFPWIAREAARPFALGLARVMLGMALPVLLWLGVTALHAGPEYVVDLVWGHGVGHALGQIDKVRPWWYYLKDFPGSILPWSLFAPALAIWLWSGSKDRGTAFTLAWLVASFVVMSLFPAKRHLYLLPLCPAAALLTAQLCHRSRSDGIALQIGWDVARSLLGLVSGLLGVGIVVASVLISLGADGILVRIWPAWEILREEVARGAVPTFAVVAGALLALGGRWLIDRRSVAGEINGIRAIGLGTAALLVGVVHPIEAVGRGPGGFYRQVEGVVGNAELAFYGSTDFAPNWMLSRDEISMLPNAAYVRTYLETRETPEWLVAEERSLARLGVPTGAERVLSVARAFEPPMTLLRWRADPDPENDEARATSQDIQPSLQEGRLRGASGLE